MDWKKQLILQLKCKVALVRCYWNSLDVFFLRFVRLQFVLFNEFTWHLRCNVIKSSLYIFYTQWRIFRPCLFSFVYVVFSLLNFYEWISIFFNICRLLLKLIYKWILQQTQKEIFMPPKIETRERTQIFKNTNFQEKEQAKKTRAIFRPCVYKLLIK